MDHFRTILLDGIWGRPRRFGRLRKALEAEVGPTEVFDYNCSGIACLQEEGRKLADAIHALGEPVNVVGFSMGGIVIRAARAHAPGLAIRCAAFINVPHSGSRLAHLGAPFKGLRGVQQLRPGSELLKRLEAADWGIPTLAVWCPLDLAVIPGSSARWKRAGECVRSDVPLHSWPIGSAKIHRRIVDFFNQSPTSANHPELMTVN